MSYINMALLTLAAWNVILSGIVFNLWRRLWRARMRQSLGLKPFPNVSIERISNKIQYLELDR